MSSITENVLRIGNPTSSQAHRLVTFGKEKGSIGQPFYTYVNEKIREKRLGRSLKLDKSSRATLWGTFLEARVHSLLPLGYQLIGHESIEHPTIKGWVGSPDMKNEYERVVDDIKCYEPDAFSMLVDNLEIAKEKGVHHFKDEHPTEYWQLVSNAVILGYNLIESVVYMPYESELLEIREEAENYDNFDQYKYRFITEVGKSELAYLPDGGHYKNLNVFRFEVPQEDIDHLTTRMKKAIELINGSSAPPIDYSTEIKKGKELKKKCNI